MSLSNSHTLPPIPSMAGGTFRLEIQILSESKSNKDLKLLSSSSSASSTSFFFDLELIGLSCDGASARSGVDVAAGRRRMGGAAAEGVEGQAGEANEEALVGGKERRGGEERAAAAPMATAQGAHSAHAHWAVHSSDGRRPSTVHSSARRRRALECTVHWSARRKRALCTGVHAVGVHWNALRTPVTQHLRPRSN